MDVPQQPPVINSSNSKFKDQSNGSRTTYNPKTTHVRDFLAKIGYIVTVSESLVKLQLPTASHNEIVNLRTTLQSMLQGLKSSLLGDSLSSAMHDYAKLLIEKVSILEKGFAHIIKIRESFQTNQKRIQMCSRMLGTIEAHKNSVTTNLSTHTNKSSNPVLRLLSLIKDIELELTSLQKLYEEDIRVTEEYPTTNTHQFSSLYSLLKNIKDSINASVSKYEFNKIWTEWTPFNLELEKLIKDIRDEINKTSKNLPLKDATVKCYMELLSTWTNNPPKKGEFPEDIIIPEGDQLMDRLSIDSLVGMVKTQVDEGAVRLRKELDTLLKALVDDKSSIMGRRRGVIPDKAATDNEKETLQKQFAAGILALDALQYISLNTDAKEIIEKLKKFKIDMKVQEGILDKIQVLTRNSSGGTPGAFDVGSVGGVKSLFGGVSSAPPITSGSWSGRQSGFLYRSIDNDLLQLYVSQISAFQLRMEEDSMVAMLSTAKDHLVEKLKNIDRYYTQTIEGAGVVDRNIVLVKQTSRKLKMGAFKSYTREVRGIMNRLVKDHLTFVTEQHRNAFAYVSYWAKRMDNKELVNNKGRALIKEYLDKREAIVTFVNNSIADEIIKDIRETLSTASKSSSVQLDSNQDIRLVQMFDNVVLWVEQKAQWITDLHIEGKQSIADVVTSPLFLTVYAMKVVRFLVAWYALRVSAKYFQEMYDSRVYAYEGDPPSPWRFIGIFIGVDALINALIMGLLVGGNYMFSDPSVNPLIEWSVLISVLVDYVATTVVVTALAGIIGHIVKQKKYFRYKYEGDRGIRAMQRMIMNVYGIVVLVPFFRIVAGTMS